MKNCIKKFIIIIKKCKFDLLKNFKKHRGRGKKVFNLPRVGVKRFLKNLEF